MSLSKYLHLWFGIPESEQPPNHFRLLGLSMFEDDTDVIRFAVEKQKRFLETQEPSTELLDQIVALIESASETLTHPESYQSYVATLQTNPQDQEQIHEQRLRLDLADERLAKANLETRVAQLQLELEQERASTRIANETTNNLQLRYERDKIEWEATEAELRSRLKQLPHESFSHENSGAMTFEPDSTLQHSSQTLSLTTPSTSQTAGTMTNDGTLSQSHATHLLGKNSPAQTPDVITLRIVERETKEIVGTIPVNDGDSIKIGRDRKYLNQVEFLETFRRDAKISGRHLEIDFQAENIVIHDVSRNGTMVHGKKIKKQSISINYDSVETSEVFIKPGDLFTLQIQWSYEEIQEEVDEGTLKMLPQHD